MVLYALQNVPARAVVLLPFLGLAAALANRGLGLLFPILWPARDEALLFAILGFAVVAFGFACQSAMLATQGHSSTRAFVRRFGHLIHLGLAQAGAVVASLRSLDGLSSWARRGRHRNGRAADVPSSRGLEL